MLLTLSEKLFAKTNGGFGMFCKIQNGPFNPWCIEAKCSFSSLHRNNIWKVGFWLKCRLILSTSLSGGSQDIQHLALTQCMDPGFSRMTQLVQGQWIKSISIYMLECLLSGVLQRKIISYHKSFSFFFLFV